MEEGIGKRGEEMGKGCGMRKRMSLGEKPFASLMYGHLLMLSACFQLSLAPRAMKHSLVREAGSEVRLVSRQS